MSRPNTLQIYLRKFHFDRLTAKAMSVYAVTFVRRNGDGMTQMYASATSFKIVRVNTPGPDLMHHWDGAGLLIGSMPTDGLESVTVETYLIRDYSKRRAFGDFLVETFKDDVDGAKIAGSVGSALTSVTGAGGVIAGAVLKIAPPLARFIGRALKRRADAVRIYGEGTIPFEAGVPLKDVVHRWSHASRGDKGYFTTYFDFRHTANPEAKLSLLPLPAKLRSRFGRPG